MTDRVEGDRVFCHQCGNTWPRAEHGLECPECASEFVEILEDGAEDDPYSNLFSAGGMPPPMNTEDHESTNDGITRHQYRSEDGRFTFVSHTYRPLGHPLGGEQDQGVPFPDPLLPIMQAFSTAFQGVNPPHRPNPSEVPETAQNRQMPLDPREFDFNNPNHPPGFARLRPRNANQPQGDAHPFEYVNDILHMFEHPEMQRGRRGAFAEGAPNFVSLGPLLAHFLSTGRHGDAVYSQEELDHVISQIIDQNMNQGNAPGPASEEAIEKLPKKKMDASMMGTDDKAECSICMDGVELGTEVTVLPCSHWFHEACITAWLREHDTCPHCRRSIASQGEQRSQSQPATPNSPSDTRSQPAGSRTNPYVLSESPPSTRRPLGASPPEGGDPGSDPQRRRSSSGQGSNGSFSDWVRQRFGGGSA